MAFMEHRIPVPDQELIAGARCLPDPESLTVAPPAESPVDAPGGTEPEPLKPPAPDSPTRTSTVASPDQTPDAQPDERTGMDGDDDEPPEGDTRRCPHLRHIKLNAIRPAIQSGVQTQFACDSCAGRSGASTPKRGAVAPQRPTWLCLTCGHIGCGRDAPEQHARNHADTKKHQLVLNTADAHVWCYGCDEDIGEMPGLDRTSNAYHKAEECQQFLIACVEKRTRRGFRDPTRYVDPIITDTSMTDEQLAEIKEQAEANLEEATAKTHRDPAGQPEQARRAPEAMPEVTPKSGNHWEICRDRAVKICRKFSCL